MLLFACCMRWVCIVHAWSAWCVRDVLQSCDVVARMVFVVRNWR